MLASWMRRTRRSELPMVVHCFTGDAHEYSQIDARPARSERAGYSVLVATGGHEALELLSQPGVLDRVALVLLDLSLLNMSGKAVRRELRKLAPRLKVAYFSGYAVEASSDVAGVIQKPTTYAALVRSVSAILEQTAND